MDIINPKRLKALGGCYDEYPWNEMLRYETYSWIDKDL
jgi:hypothetical protein